MSQLGVKRVAIGSSIDKLPCIKLPETCAYIYNNLQQRQPRDGDVTFYSIISGHEVHIAKRDHNQTQKQMKEKPDIKKVPHESMDSITVATWILCNNQLFYAMGSDVGKVYIYDSSASKLLFSYGQPPTPETRYIATVNAIVGGSFSYLYLGLSDGRVISYVMSKSGLSEPVTIYRTTYAITCLQFADGKLFIGTDAGMIVSYDAGNDKIEKIVQMQQPINPVTTMIAGDSFIVAGFALGNIKIFDYEIRSIKDITLHRRVVTGIAIENDMIATVSEDGYLNVIKNAPNLSVVKSMQCENAILCGVQFLKCNQLEKRVAMGDTSIVITTYERNKIIFV